MERLLQRITYVEDEKDIRAVAELALTKIGGFSVDVCINGSEALERVRDFSPDLILLDVMMPGIDGTEVLRRMQEMPEIDNTPIVFMTAKAQHHEVAEYIEMGAVDVIPKPFDPLLLPTVLRKIWSDALNRKAA